jgi:hypothetical protein
MTKRKRTKGQTTIYKKNTHKSKDRVTRTPLKQGVNWGAPEGWAVPEKYDVDMGHVFLTCIYSQGFW